MTIKSKAFAYNTKMPSKFTCDGDNISPPLIFSGTSQNSQSLVLIVDDPDAPAKTWVHWVLFNIPPTTSEIYENTVPENSMRGMTDFGNTDYGGPCPPSGTHRYFFKLYALDTTLTLAEGATKVEVEKAMKNHIIEKAELIGLYKRK